MNDRFDGPGYQIRALDGCRIVEGNVPLGDMGVLCHGFSKKALLAVDLADLMGVAMVIGEPEDIDRLRANRTSLPLSAARQREAGHARSRGLSDDVVRWLEWGERGQSANALCQSAFGIPDGKPLTAHPHDPDDLRRCIAFLSAAGIPDTDVFRILGIPPSPQWAALRARWGELLACYGEEIAMSPGKPVAPRTYALMREILAGVDD